MLPRWRVDGRRIPRNCWHAAAYAIRTIIEASMGPNYRPVPSRGSTPAAARGADRVFELKSEIHRKLIGVLNFDRVSSIPKDRIRAEIGRVVERLFDEERVPMTTAEQARMVC